MTGICIFFYIRINNASIKELQESERYNRLLFETSPIGLALCRMDGSLVDINSAYANIIGRTIEETKSLTYWQLTPNKYESQEEQQIKQLIEHGFYGPYVKEYIHKDGHLVPVSLNGQKIEIRGECYIWSSVEDITQRTKMENRLRAAIEFSKKTICTAPVGMAIYDQSGQCIEANQTIANILGGTKEKLLQANYHEIDSWKESGLYELALKTVNEGINGRLEKLVTTTFGKRVHLEILTSSYEVNGQTYLQLMLSDISQRKEIEMALVRSEETFARAQAIANIGNWDWNIVTGEIDWTDEIFRIFGLSPQEFKPSYDAFLERIHPDDVHIVTEAVNQTVAKNSPYNVEHRVVRPSGEVRIVHEQGIVYYEEQSPIRMIGTVHDITELKAADQAHKNQVERNEMILKTTRDGYWIVSPKDGTLLDANDSYCRMSGYSKKELIGMPIASLDSDHSEEVVQRVIQELVTKGSIQFESRHRKKDGLVYNVEVSTSLANIGDETFLVAFIKDITERKQNELQLIQYQENLEHLVNERTQALSNAQEELVRKERLATLGQLTATVSHELRNPLNAMGPSLYILNKLCPDDEKIKNAIDILQRSVWRCDHIIDDLLDYTRINSVEKQDLVLDDWLNELINEQIAVEGISIIKNYKLSNMQCHFDPNGLRRAVINVFENGCQAMIDDTSNEPFASSSMTITTQCVHNRMEIIMSDTGVGMSTEVLGKIFEPLYSTKVYGVGLGMPTIKQIMEQHQGGIEIDSTEQKGTTVTLWLPCSTSDEINTDIENKTKFELNEHNKVLSR